MNENNISPKAEIWLRTLREQLGITLKQFEAMTGLSANTLKYLEEGSKTLSATTARALSHLFMLRFNINAEEASEHCLLHGKEESDLVKKS